MYAIKEAWIDNGVHRLGVSPAIRLHSELIDAADGELATLGFAPLPEADYIFRPYLWHDGVGVSATRQLELPDTSMLVQYARFECAANPELNELYLVSGTSETGDYRMYPLGSEAAQLFIMFKRLAVQSAMLTN